MRFADFLKDQKIITPQHFIKKPRVSVIMPTYCRAQNGLLSQAITGVLSQTFSDFEFIILDDGSIDGSEGIIRDFQRQDDRILYVRHEINSGLPALRVDEGILLSKGEYIAFQFDDDNWLPFFLATITSEAMKRNKVFVHCQAEYLMSDHVFSPSFPSMQPTHASLLQRNYIANVSVLLHKSIFFSFGLYDPHVVLRRITDWDLWLRIAKHEPPYMVSEVLARVRGGLPDSIGGQTPYIEYEDFSLMFQIYRDMDLLPERIMDVDVNSLDKYIGRLPKDTLHKFYKKQVVSWLTQHKERFEKVGIEVGEIKKLNTQNHYPKLDKSLKNIFKNFTVHVLRFVGTSFDIIRKLFQHFPRLVKFLSIPYYILYFVICYCRWLFLFHHDTWNSLPSSYMEFKEDPFMIKYRHEGFLLKQSINLQYCTFIVYPLIVQDGNVYSLSLAFIRNDSNIRGLVGIEVISSEDKIVAHAIILVSFVSEKEPTKFFLDPPLNPGKYYLRVFGKHLSHPIYVHELYKYIGINMVEKPFFRFELV